MNQESNGTSAEKIVHALEYGKSLCGLLELPEWHIGISAFAVAMNGNLRRTITCLKCREKADSRFAQDVQKLSFHEPETIDKSHPHLSVDIGD